jgi:hypothetical protein
MNGEPRLTGTSCIASASSAARSNKSAVKTMSFAPKPAAKPRASSPADTASSFAPAARTTSSSATFEFAFCA